MPIIQTDQGWKWGEHGHIYPTRKLAVRQAMAAYAHGYKEPKKKILALYRKTHKKDK